MFIFWLVSSGMSVKRMLIIIKAICYTKPMKPKLLLGNSKIGCCRFNLWGSLHYLGRSFVPGCYKMRKTRPSQLQYTVKNTQYLKLKFNHINKVSKIIFLPEFISFQFFCWMSNSVFRVLIFYFSDYHITEHMY